MRIFGMMNQDIHDNKVDVMINDMGIITTERFLVGRCEIMAEYGDQYDWDEVKWKGF